jgi:CMP-2-keto-3-deoxyoctulosonic acid synthetase
MFLLAKRPVVATRFKPTRISTIEGRSMVGRFSRKSVESALSRIKTIIDDASSVQYLFDEYGEVDGMSRADYEKNKNEIIAEFAAAEAEIIAAAEAAGMDAYSMTMPTMDSYARKLLGR